MDKNQEQLLAQFSFLEPREELFDLVMVRIKKEKSLLAIKRRIFVYSACFVASLVALLPVFSWFKAGIANSEFMEFFSLLFSDFGSVMNYWQSFVLTLLETAPLLSAIAFLSVVWVMLETLKLLTRDLKMFFGELGRVA
jgi:hypothetical protein